MDIVLASGNQGKVNELSGLLSNTGLRVIPQTQLDIEGVEETGLTFIENAILKARHASKLSGMPALADDSGLAVDALQGQPGIYSARYSGVDASDESNVLCLLEALKDVPLNRRTAQFHCVLVFLKHALDPTPLVCHGVWDGLITEEVTGDGGFGYDPVFWVPELKCTAAELTRAQKSSVSHRGKALRELMLALQEMEL